MLNALREKTQGLIGGVLLVALVVPFALWGVSSYIGGASVSYVAKGRGVRVTSAAFTRALARQRTAIENAYGKELNPAVLSGVPFKKAVLNGLINKILLLKNARAAHYHVSPAEVADEIRQIPAFQVKGVFNLARYQALLANQGFTPAGFERRVMDLTLVNQLRVGLVASAFMPTPTLVHAVSLLGETRQIAYTIVSPRRYEGQISLNPVQIQHYYATHTNLFKIPQKVRVDYVILSPQSIARRIQSTITPAQLKRAYQQHIQEFRTPATRDAQDILISLPAHPRQKQIAAARAKLMQIRAQIIHGASFSSLAKRYSQASAGVAPNGDLGYVTRGDVSKPFGQALFALRVGQVSMPVLGDSGMHLIKLKGIHPAIVESLAVAKKVLTQQIARRLARKRLYRLSERLRNVAFEHPHSLVPAAQALHLTVHKSRWFDRSGGPGLASLPKVVQAVFRPPVLAGRQNTRAIPIGEDAIVIAHVVARKPSQTQSLVLARPAIIARLRQNIAKQKAQEVATKLVTGLRGHASFDVLVKRAGLTPQMSAPFTETTVGLPKRLVAAVFKEPAPIKGATSPVVGLVSLSRGRQAVFIVRAVHLGSVTQNPALAQKLSKQLASDASTADYIAYLKTARTKADIKIMSGAL